MLFFKSLSFNSGSWQRQQSKVIVHVPWPEHIPAGLARRMDSTKFYKELTNKADRQGISMYPMK